MLLKYNIQLSVQIGDRNVQMEASWQDIQAAWEKDHTTPLIFRSIPKITKDHIEPAMQKKMKVRTGYNFYFLYCLGNVPERALWLKQIS